MYLFIVAISFLFLFLFHVAGNKQNKRITHYILFTYRNVTELVRNKNREDHRFYIKLKWSDVDDSRKHPLKYF